MVLHLKWSSETRVTSTYSSDFHNEGCWHVLGTSHFIYHHFDNIWFSSSGVISLETGSSINLQFQKSDVLCNMRLYSSVILGLIVTLVTEEKQVKIFLFSLCMLHSLCSFIVMYILAFKWYINCDLYLTLY